MMLQLKNNSNTGILVQCLLDDTMTNIACNKNTIAEHVKQAENAVAHMY